MEKVYKTSGVIVAMLILFVFLEMILASGYPDRYYVQSMQTSYSTNICVFADVNWRPDPTVFCASGTDTSLQMAVEKMDALNKSLVQKKQ